MWSKYIFPALITITIALIGLAIILRIPGVGSTILPTAASPATGKKLVIAA